MDNQLVDRIYAFLAQYKFAVAYQIQNRAMANSTYGNLRTTSFGATVTYDHEHLKECLFTTKFDTNRLYRPGDTSLDLFVVHYNKFAKNPLAKWHYSRTNDDIKDMFNLLESEGYIENLSFSMTPRPQSVNLHKAGDVVASFNIIEEEFTAHFEGRTWTKSDFFNGTEATPRAIEWFYKFSGPTIAYLVSHPDCVEVVDGDRKHLISRYGIPTKALVMKSKELIAKEPATKSEKGKRRDLLNAARRIFASDPTDVLTKITGVDMSYALGVEEGWICDLKDTSTTPPCFAMNKWKWTPTKAEDTLNDFDRAIAIAEFTQRAAEKCIIQTSYLKELYKEHGQGRVFLDWVAETLVDDILDRLPVYMGDEKYEELIAAIMKT